jgi:hypothetical protein
MTSVFFRHDSYIDDIKGCTRLAATSDEVFQLLAHGWWLSLGTPASSTTKTGGHGIAEILLKVALKHQKCFIGIALLIHMQVL